MADQQDLGGKPEKSALALISESYKRIVVATQRTMLVNSETDASILRSLRLPTPPPLIDTQPQPSSTTVTGIKRPADDTRVSVCDLVASSAILGLTDRTSLSFVCPLDC